MAEDTTGVWDEFSKSTREIVNCGETGCLAQKVFETFSVPVSSFPKGGPLDNLDIKQMNAMSVVRLSLLEEAAASYGKLYEPVVSADGIVEFVNIGSNNVSLGTVYYTVQSNSYNEVCGGVMVTGGKPLAVRKTPGFNSILTDKIVFDTQKMLSTCMLEEFKQHATVTFNDPNFDTTFNDGIDNFYEINTDNPYDKVIGYAYKITPDQGLVNDDTSIIYGTQCEVPILIADGEFPNIGDLIRAPTTAVDLACWAGMGYEPSEGEGVALDSDLLEELRYESVRGTTVDKFEGVTGVFIVGIELDACAGRPTTDAEAIKTPTKENTQLYISSNNLMPKVFKLDSGVHYVVSYVGEGITKKVKIVFANNARLFDEAKFGTEVEFKTMPSALYNAGITGPATILPTGGTKGIWVKEVWATVSLDSPNFTITDPKGDALSIAEALVVECAPIVLTEEPAPVAKDGVSISLKEGIIDNDPTTTQDLTDTPYETALKEIAEGNGMSLSLSFLDGDGVVNLSKTLKEYLTVGDIVETTYVCGPDCGAEIGDKGLAGGIVNNITYSYSDRGSYTISVNEGPKIVGGFEGISGGPYMKQIEEHSSGGTVIQDAGNHVDYKVHIDAFGDRDAINCCPHVLRVGDRVQVSVHNNPIED